VWSIYALDIETDTTLTLIPPTPGFDIGFPALSQTSDNFLTFDTFNQQQGVSTILAGNLTSGALMPVGQVIGGLGAPGFNGDDTAIVYSQVDPFTPTGFSLVRQALAADGITPSGQPTDWLDDAGLGVIYRRGPFTGPEPTATPTDLPTRTFTPTPIVTATPTLAMATATSTATTASPTSTPTQGEATATASATVTGSPTDVSTPTPTATAEQTAPTATATPGVTTTPTDTPTRRPTSTEECTGDCDGNGTVGVSELLLGVNIALDRIGVTQCRAFDVDEDGIVAIHELVAGVESAARRCP
jgi:hypothetical protein